MANKPSTSKDCEVDDKEQEEKQEENTCPEITSLNCPEGSDLEDEKDSKGCSIGYKCRRVLSNGIESEIKIMPETASEKAIERLGELDFIIELKEVGKGDEVKAVYEAKAKKQGNFLGLFKIKGEVIVNIDSETGEIVYIKKPWWSFLVSGI